MSKHTRNLFTFSGLTCYAFMLSGLTKLVHQGLEATQRHLVPCYLTVSPPEPAVPAPLKFGMSLWLEPWNGEGKGDVGQTHPGSWVLLVLSLWRREKGLGAKSTNDTRHRERPPYCYGQRHFSYLCCDLLVGTAQCLELLGQRGLHVSVITLCSASDPWCVLVINLFVSKQKACSALIHRILNLVLSQRNSLPCGTEWPVQL